jgi:radical SAM superfamily enzyme
MKMADKPSKTYGAGEQLNSRFPSKVAARVVAITSATRPDLLNAAKVRAAKMVKAVRAQNGVRGRKHKKVARVVKASVRASK